jgi:hypothetical protein
LLNNDEVFRPTILPQIKEEQVEDGAYPQQENSN